MMELHVIGSSRTAFSGVVWPVVMRERDLALAEAARPIGDGIEQEMSAAASTVALAATTAEASINEFILSDRTPVGIPDLPKSPYDKIYRPTRKWIDVTKKATGDPHVGGRAPLQQLQLLFKLRNMLMHYLPEDRVLGFTAGVVPPAPSPLEQEEQRLEVALAREFTLSARCPSNPFLHRVLCGAGAEWATGVASACVHQLYTASRCDIPHWFA